MEHTIDTYCGLKCVDCGYKEANNCGGCVATEGKPFHGACEIAECAKGRKRRFCGECEDFPCEIITRYSNDPRNGDKGARIERCKEIKGVLVKEARAGINPVGICGHHCDHCFLGEWCGGCRSSYNCCSYATICEGNVCPNLSCAQEKSLESCSQCDELSQCEKGYYGIKEEYIAKAAAIFIKEHGEACYSQTLKRAIEAGKNYPKDFDKKGSVAKAVAALKEFL